MANIKGAFGSSTALTHTLNSLAHGSARESTAVDNSTNLYIDAVLRITIALATGTPTGDKRVNIYAYGSEDGTNYSDNATGSDAAITLRSPTNLAYIGAIYTPDSGGLTYKSLPFAVARAFGGVLPRKWGIVVQNKTGLAFAASGCSSAYSGFYLTST